MERDKKTEIRNLQYDWENEVSKIFIISLLISTASLKGPGNEFKSSGTASMTDVRRTQNLEVESTFQLTI